MDGKRWRRTVALALGLAVAWTPVTAQEIEQVVVTASKRAASEQDTAISMTVLSGEELAEGNLTDLRDIHLQTPGLFITSNEGFGGSPLSIRGVGSLALGIGAEDGVGVYVDGVFQGRPFGHVFEFVDVERIEVLRGPQGTLYGRNATGGAINVVTLAPGEEFVGRGEIMASSFGGMAAQGVLAGPIGDGVGAKASFAVANRDGYADNPTRGEDVYDKNNAYFSGALAWRPSEALSAVLRAYGGETNSVNGFKDLLDGLDIDTIPADFGNRDERSFRGVNFTVEWTSGAMSVRSVTATVESDQASNTDSDGGPQDIVQFRQEQDAEQFSQEVVVAYEGGGRVGWLLGGLFFAEEARQSIPFDLRQLPLGIHFDSAIDTEAVSAFAEVRVEASERLALTVGARYSTEEKTWRHCMGFYGAFETDFDERACRVPGVSAVDADQWDTVTPRFVAEYAASDRVLWYASATKGFRSGGWNITENLAAAFAAGDADPGFDQEFVWSFEAGVKSDLADNRVRLNAAVFNAAYTDMQVRVDDPTTRLLAVSNAGEATITGAEAELTVLATPDLFLQASVALLDATYDEFKVTDAAGNVRDSRGKRLNRAPELTASLIGAYTVSVRGGSVTARLEYQYVSETFHSEANDLALFRGSAPFEHVNARVRFAHGGGRWHVELFGDNLTDDRWYEHSFEPIQPGLAPTVISAPRMVGVRIGVSAGPS